MKKNLLIITCTFALSLFFVQCNSKDNAKEKESDIKNAEKVQNAQSGKEVENTVQTVKAIIEGISKQCPIMMDEITRLDKCSISDDGKTVSYFYTITDISGMNVAVFKGNIREVLVEMAKTNPDMKLLRIAKMTVNYKYNDPKGNEITTVVITPKDYE